MTSKSKGPRKPDRAGSAAGRNSQNVTSLRIKIWGARGSLPAPATPDFLSDNVKDLIREFLDRGYRSKKDIPKFVKELPHYRLGGFGGNTPCIEISSPQQQIIIDGGSGIRPLGYELLAGPCGRGKGEVHIFFTHFHWDHLIGLPFFMPVFIGGNKIHLYAVQPELPEVFKTLFKKPYFPVPLEKLGAELHYHVLEPRKPVRFGDMMITPYMLDHPDPCWGYRVERNGKIFSHCVDTECTRISREQLGPDLPLYEGVDLMIFDAQYTLTETIERMNWGHAAASLGLDIAMREGIKEVVFMHHDPASSDEKISAAENQARQYYQSQLKTAGKMNTRVSEVKWSFAHEGMVIEI